MTDPTSTQTPEIRRLTIERFRGIQSLTWRPEPGLNVIIGGGDTGKTAILDAIGLLLSPTNTSTISDYDYCCRQVEREFVIEAAILLPSTAGVNQQAKMAWPWEWDGQEPRVPDIDTDPSTESESVYCVRVRGTPELELAYEILQPDGSTDTFTVGLRRRIGLVRLSGDDRNDRDLRLVQGSALDRLLADKSLRARLGQTFASTDVAEILSESAQTSLRALNNTFGTNALPSSLGLGLAVSQGLSIGALIGLTAVQREVSLPLSSWGAGTRRIAALTIAGATQGDYPVTIVDEVERGLEPYRQRLLMARLEESKSQVFLTTHSAVALSAASEASLWYLDISGQIGRLPKSKVHRHQTRDPEAFLARLAIVAEGQAEVGFVSLLLERDLGQHPQNFGVWITDGQGHESALDLLEALAEGGLKFGGFVDNEADRHPKRWDDISKRLDHLLHRWPSGCLEDNVISLIDPGRLEELIKDPREEKTGDRLRTLADRLGLKEKDFARISQAAGGRLKEYVIDAALGKVPGDMTDASSSEKKKAFKRHQAHWFKSESGGRELAEKVFTLGAWPSLQTQVLPFLDAVRQALGLHRSARISASEMASP